MPQAVNSIGQLSKTAISHSLIDQTIDFIWSSLIPWKEDPERPFAEAEEDLNAQIQNFLQSRANEVFPMVLFQHERRQQGRRKVDLSVNPIRSITINGVGYNRYTPIIVIEGKRLPAPTKSREREYVTGGKSVSGGIQRFKLGVHGKEHETVIILGYVQQKPLQDWYGCINVWISELAETHPGDWDSIESLSEFQSLDSDMRARSVSVHPRVMGCRSKTIRILHFWIQCSSSQYP
ncbi:hypothetical protein [Pseudohongiella nitratireducens]|uniref:hypothetical protein n=1 Tax=Pseudohongiella nitratireducens TaxID=1768907 RepID=UPI0030EC7F32|tara:strand:+ start:7424 stop:8128 length:705 start_codon:yes stop_codon:yes gene_type:complete